MARLSGRVTPGTCTICGEDNTRPVETAIFTACPVCMRALMCVANGIPTEVSPSLRAALEAM